jgi:DNA-binding response OmpR family regulator
MANVLLVEPDYKLARVYRSALVSCGYEVYAALSAQAAVAAADADPPDIVVLELQLPRHNGVEFLYEFRSYADWQDVPILVHSMVPIGEIAMESQGLRDLLGVRDYLYKPQTTLAELVHRVMGIVEA